MTDSLDAPNIYEDFLMPETARRDALLEMLAKYKVYKEHCDTVEAAKENRYAAEDEYEAARVIAEDVCTKTNYTGTMVRGTIVINIFGTGISISDGEILE